ncbi:hypothetical protein L1887_49670 [Cichorium endivia]|nr:hypothetical protein L1887_49670 [Cichorium endivia]
MWARKIGKCIHDRDTQRSKKPKLACQHEADRKASASTSSQPLHNARRARLPTQLLLVRGGKLGHVASSSRPLSRRTIQNKSGSGGLDGRCDAPVCSTVHTNMPVSHEGRDQIEQRYSASRIELISTCAGDPLRRDACALLGGVLHDPPSPLPARRNEPNKASSMLA